MKSMLHTGASLLLKVKYENGTSKVIGYATGFTYSVTQGQKAIYTVDNPMPAEIAQSAGPSQVRGSLVLFLPKGTTPESEGLVPFRVDGAGNNIMASSGYMNFEIYDRATMNLVVALEYCKVGNYTVSMMARGIVQVNLTFEGIMATSGMAL
jgi:hypothetical protein